MIYRGYGAGRYGTWRYGRDRYVYEFGNVSKTTAAQSGAVTRVTAAALSVAAPAALRAAINVVFSLTADHTWSAGMRVYTGRFTDLMAQMAWPSEAQASFQRIKEAFQQDIWPSEMKVTKSRVHTLTHFIDRWPSQFVMYPQYLWQRQPDSSAVWAEEYASGGPWILQPSGADRWYQA